MPEYRCPIAPGATFFFTVVTNFRRPILAGPAALGFLRTTIKGRFTDLFLAGGGTETPRSASRRKRGPRGQRGVWQRRFWDHVIRDDDDYGRHMDYIHYNSVTPGLVRCPHAWPHSSFAKWVRQGAYAADWMCLCADRPAKPPDFGDVEGRAGE